MSPRALAVAVIFAVVIVVIAFVVGSGGPGHPESLRILSFDPAQLTAIEVQSPQGHDRIERTTSGGWRWVNPDDQSMTWPAILPGAAQTATARLATLEPERLPDADPIPDDAWTITFSAGETTESLKVARQTLGGLSRAQNTAGERFLVETDLIKPLVDPGLASWRIARAIPGLFDASRIWIEKGDRALTLARVQGKWSIIQPVAARASADSVSALLDALAAVSVEQFQDRDNRSAAELGLTNPSTSVRLQRDERASDASGEVRTSTQESTLLVGDPADPTGALRFAAPTADAPMLLLVSSTAVASIPTDPKSLLDPTASGVLPSDVFAININTLGEQSELKREMGNWSGAPAAQLDALLEFLCTTPGEPDVLATGDSILAASRVELLSLSGDRLDLISIGYTADALLAAQAGSVIWTYPNAEPPALLNLPAFDDMPERPDFQPATDGAATYSK